MLKRIARYMLAKHWDGKLPVDAFAIARSENVTVQREPDMGAVYGRFEFVDGQPRIVVNGDAPELRQRFVVAHHLGHLALEHGTHFTCASRQFSLYQLDEIENQANRFALEMLVPGFALNILIQKRNITNFHRLTDAFEVSELAMKLRLKQLGWIKRARI
ncbi:ImmA/IrrE family metallo-endopeptidase [Caballeronia sp. LZ043]|uniref:ImmA/IrrE family metallo-endopeptidase n=1 Tax=Caballeronia sp. LZ043 TaxID=3038569 RepID=UPI00285E8682|nr:ImmA/IrrE family metallo-endopeptidase [Caballeronia sp. LZ043]MDR5820766.1 ImmA/IrrE family metallo-endopeptidase [Caballeronia sp. LZ043]